jgi:glucosamine-6-phosphate deaminase
MTDHGLNVRRFPDRTAMGRAAASDIAAFMRERLAQTGTVRMIFAAAPSQSDMLAALVREPGIDWPAVTAFHMDEYPSLPPEAPQRFGNWLRRELFDPSPSARST